MKVTCKFVNRIWMILLAMILLCPLKVSAAVAIDTEAKANLTVNFIPDETPAEGTEFRVYKIADVSRGGEFTLTETFAEYPLALNGLKEEDWSEVTTALQGYIAADDIAADYTENVDAEGAVTFEEMTVGLYLVAGDIFQANRSYYTPQAFVISLPNLTEEDTWQYDVETTVKYEAEADSEPISIEILKIWADNDYSGRPEEIQVEVYEGDELYETITLNQENNWRYQLTDLYGGSVWSVKEKDVPEGYEVSVEKQTSRFVITNTMEVPDEPGDKLPQTGVLWWPVPVLAAAGLLFIMLGYLRRRGNEDEN